jgi:glycogen synthase
MYRKPYTAFDAEFSAKVDAWQPLPRGFIDAFGADGFRVLNERERTFRADRRKIVSLTFENRFAPLGGLAAVMRFLPGYLKKAGEDVIILTPHYVNIPRVGEAVDSGALEPVIPKRKFDSPLYGGTLRCYRNSDAPVPAYFIGVDGRFTAESNPYSYADADDLLKDALAFCGAVPFVMRELGFDRDILFHAHDWETALIALASKQAVLDGVLENARTVLTLHNSFDSGFGGLSGVGGGAGETGANDDAANNAAQGSARSEEAREEAAARRVGITGHTVLQCSIPLLNGPLTTVSAPFARELRYDALQRTVFTNHLQTAFSVNPPVGIENGMFGRPYLQYTYSALSRARQGVFDVLLTQKARFRERMLSIVESTGASNPKVVGRLKDVADGKLVFFMSGRLDLSQKGFDVMFRAFQKFPPGKAGLIFCPSSAEGAKHAKDLAFFKKIALERDGDMVIWPFRVSSDDYVSIVLGSSFLLMPSFYEPFGAATEGFMHGTPVVARATGGLQVQVGPLAGEEVGESTGILYRERPSGVDGRESDSSECEGWKEILGLPVNDRMRVPLYQSMVDEAFGALLKAAAIFADRHSYGRMVLNGMDSLKSFSWDAAVNKYRRVYDAAARRGFFDN